MWKWYVYIIECEDKSYYIGMTWNPEIRLRQHLSGLGSAYTGKHQALQIVYLEEYENFEKARQRERQLHGWTRGKKEKLIRGEWGMW